MSSSRLRIWAWTETSRADTGSSQISTCGSITSDRAMLTRWHWPPDSWCGRREAASVSRPTVSSSWLTRNRRFSTMPQITSGSATMSTTIRRGLSELIGSWKISCIFGRSSRSASAFRVVSSVPSNVTLPLLGRGSCTRARPVVDLPQPDSPTSPRVSPRATSKLTSDTACNRPPLVVNSTTRCSTRSTMSSRPSRSAAVPLPAISGAPLLLRPPARAARPLGTSTGRCG